MQLRGPTIKKRVEIQGIAPERVRRASYEVAVGSIIDPSKGFLKEGSVQIPERGGVVKVISSEILKVPKNLAGYASVKTSLSNKSVLALNIGIVDPGWEGPLSAALVNFGKIPVEIKVGDAFLHVTFHELDAGGDDQSAWEEEWSHEEPGPWNKDREANYRRLRELEAKAHLGGSFMDVHRLVDEIADKKMAELFGKLKDRGFQILTWFVPLLAVIVFFLTIGTFALNFVGPWRAAAVTERQLRQQVDVTLRELLTEYGIQAGSARLTPSPAPPPANLPIPPPPGKASPTPRTAPAPGTPQPDAGARGGNP